MQSNGLGIDARANRVSQPKCLQSMAAELENQMQRYGALVQRTNNIRQRVFGPRPEAVKSDEKIAETRSFAEHLERQVLSIKLLNDALDENLEALDVF